MEWAQVQALRADGVSQREIAQRLGLNRRTVARLAAASEPPRYQRAGSGSQLDRFDGVLRELLVEWPQIKAPRATEVLREHGYEGSVELVKQRLRGLRPVRVRPAQRTAYRPGQVVQFDWAEMPSRPRIAGRERRVYALVASLPFSGAQTAFFSFDLGLESFLEGHARTFAWLGGVPRECVYDNLRSAVASREQDRVTWNPRFLHLRGHYGFHATACTPATPREKGSVKAACAASRPDSGRRGGSPRCSISTRSTPTGATTPATAASTPPAASRSLSTCSASARRCGRC